ncbi:MAG: MotA/TolQ/ExbB proton channel family protein [Spirochaetales bacterium]|nr:MotA/TolQ/ExbB proton channel family protein [Spirochaetales bacterium]
MAEHWERRLAEYDRLPGSSEKLLEHLDLSLRPIERRAFFLWKENEPLRLARFLLDHPGVHPQEVRRFGEDLIWRMNRRTPALATLSQLSPLIGLLGTITGMIVAFSTISQTESPSMASLATGIWEALITTAAGLIVAIPAQAGHAILERLAARRIHLMNSISGLFLAGPAEEHP